jgi:hypothetical protein
MIDNGNRTKRRRPDAKGCPAFLLLTWKGSTVQLRDTHAPVEQIRDDL